MLFHKCSFTYVNIGKKDPNEEPEESDLTKLVNQINEYIGVGDVIADDADWLPLTRLDRKKGKLLNKGRLAVSLSIVPKSEVESRPVGTGTYLLV
jgi:hypothetical protein